MSIVQFLKDKIFHIIAHFLSLLIVSFILLLFNENLNLIITINLILFFFFTGSLAFEFYKMKDYYDEVLSIFRNIEEKTYIIEIVKKPTFYSGEIFYEILKGTTKKMNDHIWSLKNARQSYNDYIELWVHEIKTPITAIKLILNNHRTFEKPALQSELLKVEGYVEQALFYARSDTLNQDYKIESFTLHSVVTEAVKALSINLIRVNANIQMEQLDIKVTSDTKWIIFILKQIIDNAIKYRKDSLTIAFSTQKQDAGTWLLIADNGIGIEASDINSIFTKGFTGTNGRSYIKSTGMGLYLCHTLTQKLGLKIQAESDIEKGTMIKIFFPNKLKIFH